MYKVSASGTAAMMLALALVVTGCEQDLQDTSADPTTENALITPLQTQAPLMFVPVCADAEGCQGIEDTAEDPTEVSAEPETESIDELCPSLGQGFTGNFQPLLAHATEHGLTVVRGDGTKKKVTLPSIQTVEGAKVRTRVVSRYPYLMVHRSWRKPMFASIRGTAFSMFTHDGELLWHTNQSGFAVRDLQVLDSGDVVGVQIFYPTDGPVHFKLMVMDHTGSITQHPHHEPLGQAVLVDGKSPYYALPVRQEEGEDPQVGWLNLSDGTLDTLWAGASATDLKLLGRHLFHGSMWCDGLYNLVVSTAGGGTDFLPLEELSPSNPNEILQVTPTGWVLIRDNETGEHWRLRIHRFVHHVTVAVAPELLDLTPPGGFETFGSCGNPKVTLDPSGRPLMSFRTSSKALAFRLDPDAGIWEAIGAPMAGIQRAQVSSEMVSYTVDSSATYGNLCGGGAFEESADDTTPIDGPSVQVVHVESGNTFILDPVPSTILEPQDAAPVFHYTGMCFATVEWTGGPTWLQVVDTVTGKTTKVTIPGISTWL